MRKSMSVVAFSVLVSHYAFAGDANLADDNDHHSDYKHKNKYNHKHGG
jgi:hypothetical protein